MNKKKVVMTKVPVIDLKATGQNIAKLRADAGISVRDLQEVFGFANPQAIYKWQNGCCLPSIDNLVILAAVLGTSIDEILVFEDEQSDDMGYRYEFCWSRQSIARQLNNRPVLS